MNDKTEKILKSKMSGIKGNFIMIPSSIIFDKNIGSKRVGVFSYFSCKTSLDYSVLFSLKLINEWFGKKLDKHKGKTEDMIKIINNFKEKDIISFSGDIGITTLTEAEFDKDKMIELFKGEERFAKIYVDEINTIRQYKNPNPKDNRLDNAVVLLVFAYMRAKIPVRNNLAGAKYKPDAYDTYYKKIGEEIGLSERMVSRAVEVLVKLGLIYEKKRSSVVYCEKVGEKTKRIHVPKTSIFCNTYKRIKGKDGKTYLVAEGKSYYLKEVADKEKMLDQYSNRKR